MSEKRKPAYTMVNVKTGAVISAETARISRSTGWFILLPDDATYEDVLRSVRDRLNYKY